MMRFLGAPLLLAVLLLAGGSDAARPPPRGVPRARATRTARSPARTSTAKGKSSPANLFSFLAPAPPPPPPPRGLLSLFNKDGAPSSTSKTSPSKPKKRSTRGSVSDSPRLDLLTVKKALVEDLPTAVKARVAEVRPLQIFSGFALASVLFGGTIVGTANVITEYLQEDENGPVLERTLQFGTILENVMTGYVDQNVDLNKLFETGVNSMLETLDPFSTYENVQASEDLQVRTTGRYGGVGLTIGKGGDEEVLVISALEGFAFDAGVRPGDRILKIDGVRTRDKEVDEVKNLLRGEPGSSLVLTVQRDGAPEGTLDIQVPRKLVRLPDVTLAAVDRDGVGYMKLEGFSEGTAQETGRAILRMQKEAGGELEALIIDMRDNPGGLLDAAVAVSQQLVPEGTEIVSTAGRVYGEGASLSYRSTKPPLLSPRTRVVVLVNPNTASAAEIVTGVVQDTDRGVVVGERTYGKGLVQIVEPLPGGGALKLTVAKYYTPSGRCIQAVDYGGGRLEAKAKPKAADAAAAAAPLLPAVPAGEGGEGGVGAGGGGAGGVGAGGVGAGAPGAAAPAGPVSPPVSPPAALKPDPSSSSSSRSVNGVNNVGGRRASAASAASAAKAAEPAEPLGGRAGAVSRLDPSEPSRPKAAVPDAGKSFVTAHGRPVTAGGGIVPDVVVKNKPLGELERALLQRGLFFDFSGEWLKKHPAPPEALASDVVRLQDETYREFVAYVKQRLSNGGAGGVAIQADGAQGGLDDGVDGAGGEDGEAAPGLGGGGGSGPGGKAPPPPGPGGSSKKPALTLEPPGLQRQFDALAKSIEGDNHRGSARELAALRKMILEEQLEEFRTQKPRLQRDLTETLLGRLTRPSERLASQLTEDPQVREARAIAADKARYSHYLDPTPEGLTTLNAKNKASETENVLLFPLEGRL